MAILELRGVTLELGGRPILNGLNAESWEGRVHALVGPNGAGKSTPASTIMGLPGYTDNGLLVPSAKGDRRCKYVSYEDVARVHEVCGRQSVVAVFQHFARRKWPDDLLRLGEDLRQRSGLEHLSCIAPDGLVAYFIATKSDNQDARLWKVLEDYGERHSCRYLVRL